MSRVLHLTLCLVAIAATASCRRGAADTEAAEPPTLDVTHWTDRSELFMEYPPLVAGETALFAVHLTRLEDFSAMTAGRPHIELIPEGGGAAVRLQGNTASRPGVFRVEARLPAAGRYTWALVVDADVLMDRHELGAVTIFATQAAALADAGSRAAEDPAAISYLKEPQWTTPFAAAVVAERDLRATVRLPATIGPLTGGDAVVSAPADGRFAAPGLLAIGDYVLAGQDIGRLQPRLADEGRDRATLEAAVTEARAAAEGARAELQRAERLLDARAVPARRVDDARRARTIAEARLAAAEARLRQRDETLASGGGEADGNAFVLRAPIDGTVTEVAAVLGASYEEGAPLFRITRNDRVELQVLVPAANAPLQGQVGRIALEIPGRAEPVVVQADHMHDGGMLDPVSRALPVQFHIDNSGGQLLIGQSLTALIDLGGRQRTLAVPAAAVLYEAGRPFAFVQTGGESFVRRFIEVGVRDGDLVGIRSGLRAGERVVTVGAFEIQRAAAAGGVPAEGHVH